ncbi:unnamed protein product [Cryptosporidium hominis]|uniref:Uncharacterized protein n=1 Tax=Cryptosporidium hominis TaxID=237895 RepID=A0A0S4TFK3_CRYHO|nr:unnamed protein product [Cryptosporidium hominis]
MRKGSVWNSVIASNENSLNSIDIENMKKQMMLERFQREKILNFSIIFFHF